jgi:ABC-type uncharacterized transport system auxiliary subunit
MRRIRLRNALNAIFGVALVLAACRPVKQMSALGKDLKHEFGRPILVSMARHGQMILVIPPAQGDTLDPPSLARQVAEYAVAHYQHKTWLKSVTVIFDAGDSDSTMTFGNYTWSADDLSGKPKAVAGTPGQKSD